MTGMIYDVGIAYLLFSPQVDNSSVIRLYWSGNLLIK